MRDYMDRPVTSPTWGSPPPRRQALKDPTTYESRSCTFPLGRTVSKKLVNKTTTLHVHYPLLPVFVRLRHEVAYFYVLRRTSTSDDEILFVCLKLDMVPRNSISEGFAYM